MDQLRFSITEILSLIGVTQCVYVLVYMSMRAGRISRAGLALLYFFVLGLAFMGDFGQTQIAELIPHFETIRWFAWFYGPPLSVLLIIQIAEITKVPALRHYWVLLLPPLAFFAAQNLASDAENLSEWLVICGLIAGAISLLKIWFKRQLFDRLYAEKNGKARYWLVLSLIFMNISLLILMLAGLNEDFEVNNLIMARSVLGLGFVYLVSTSLFRIYPQAVQVEPRGAESFSDADEALAQKIERLLTLEKVYQEASYSRMDLARECDASETTISKVINAHFGKSFPQLMNEYRIEDAKRLLRETDAPIKVVAEDVGFNSLASFNRVFKEMTGDSPSKFRKNT